MLEEHIIFVRILTDTISSLTMHYINQFSKQNKIVVVAKPDVH